MTAGLVVTLLLVLQPLTYAALSSRAGAHTGGERWVVEDGVGQLLNHTSSTGCTLLLLNDPAAPPSTLPQTFNRLQQAVAVFEARQDGHHANATQPHLSRLVAHVRQVRQTSRCVTLVVVSDDPAFLASFAHWSLKGRLLVWSTRLLILTRTPTPQISDLTSHWTFTMMNTMLVSVQHEDDRPRLALFSFLPYSAAGAQLSFLASWTQRRGLQLTTPRQLFPEKYLNFHGATVNVTALPYTPHWIEEAGGADGAAKTYSGTDYLLLATIAATLNFTVSVLPTASWDEVARRVEERVSFMATVFHNMLPQRLKRYDYSYTYEYGSLDFSAVKPGLSPQWQSLYYPLSNGAWLALLVVLVVVPVLVFVVNMMDWRLQKERRLGAGAVVELVVATLLGQMRPLPTATASRLAVAAWLVFGLVVGTVYRGNLTAALTLPKYPPRPETLEQLINTFDSITMPPFGEEFIRFFRQSDSVLYKSLAERMTIVPNVVEGLRRARDHKEAHVAGRRYMEQMIARYFSTREGQAQLYVGREKLLLGISAWPLPHDAPYRPQLDRLMMAVVEAGLYEKWSRDMLQWASRESRLRRQQDDDDDASEADDAVQDLDRDRTRALNLVHMQGPLYLLLLGLVLAGLAFLTEVAVMWLSRESE